MSASTVLVSLLAALACVGSCGNGEGEEMCNYRQCTDGPEDVLALIPGAYILNWSQQRYVGQLSADVCMRVTVVIICMQVYVRVIQLVLC